MEEIAVQDKRKGEGAEEEEPSEENETRMRTREWGGEKKGRKTIL